MQDFLNRHPFFLGIALILRRWFDHHVARDSAALTYYLLFALFPLLIFLNNLIASPALSVDYLLVSQNRTARFAPVYSSFFFICQTFFI